VAHYSLPDPGAVLGAARQRPGDDYPWQLREGQHVTSGERSPRELPGGFRKSAHRGRIISVS
jgi:hypothetical protein